MKLLLTFYGDDFTGSTDVLEQLWLAGVSAMLFVEPPTKKQLARFKGLQAIGIAGKTRALTPAAMEKELRPALRALKSLGAPHVHYKVCSTFDSSPTVGSIGRVMEIGAEVFHAPFIPLVAAAPVLGRYTIFGNHFARYGIGSSGAIYRLDRHPSVSKHPITPMTEADLRVHLAKQTRQQVALFDVLKVELPEAECRAALETVLAEKPDAVLFDALSKAHLQRIGKLLNRFAGEQRPLFSVGSSGIEMALASQWKIGRVGKKRVLKVPQILVGSGSCSPVSTNQIQHALKKYFAEVAMNTTALAKGDRMEVERAIAAATKFLAQGKSVIVHTTKEKKNAALKDTANVLGTALGKILRGALERAKIQRVCVAGGDTSSYAARALGIQALEMIAPLTPGAPLCRAHAAGSSVDGCEVIFKGGQVGAENYFETVLKGS